MRRRSLPQVVIPVPCHVDWNTMTRIDSDGRARFCKDCERPVYESASMTRDELVELIAGTRAAGCRACSSTGALTAPSSPGTASSHS